MRGETPGLRLKWGGIVAVVGSPPFTQGYSSGGGINIKGYEGKHGPHTIQSYQGTGSQRAEGNLETMKFDSIEDVLGGKSDD